MRVSPVLAFVFLGCAIARAQDVTPQPSETQSGVTVNLEALPVPTPRWKPSPDELRPLAQVRPRFKPEPEVLAAIAAIVPLPRWKPESELAAVEPPKATPATPVAAPPAVATPPAPPAAPVTIVGPTQSPYDFPVEISGIAQDPHASQKPINPLEGFAVLSRVRFTAGKTSIPPRAQPTLDIVVARLLSSRERVKLAAFSGRAGDASSEARRLSLARALAIRSYLVAKGVPVDRVDVLAFGGATDGVSDRVDVLVRGI